MFLKAHPSAEAPRPAAGTHLSAVRSDLLFKRTLPLPDKELSIYTDINKIPGKDLVRAPLSQRIELVVDPAPRKGIQPDIHMEIIRPGIIHGTVLIRIEDHFGKSPVPAREHALKYGPVRLMPVVVDGFLVLHLPNLGLHRVGKIEIVILPEHRRPLEGGKGLRYKE